MQSHVAITSSVYLKNNTLKEQQQRFGSDLKHFLCSGKKITRNQSLTQTSVRFSSSGAGTQSVFLHQILGVDAFWKKLTCISDKNVFQLLFYFVWSSWSGRLCLSRALCSLTTNLLTQLQLPAQMWLQTLCSSTVYFPLGISRGKGKLMGTEASKGNEVAEMVK